MCAVYIPPQHTANLYSKKVDYFQCLYDGLFKYIDKGNIIITGDFNARVGVDFSEPVQSPNLDRICPSDITITNKSRLSCDSKVNNYGKKLLQLCKSFNLHIANGSVPGDKLGSFTCYGNRGANVVDYVICDYNVINVISKLKILPPEFGSVHSPISVKLDYKVYIHKSDESLLPPPPKFKWEPSKANTFSLMLDRDDNLNRLRLLKEKLDNENVGNKDLDDVTTELTNVLFDNANTCLSTARRRRARQGTNSSKSNPWYSSECVSIKKRLTNLSKLLIKSSKDPFIRGKYCNLKK